MDPNGTNRKSCHCCQLQEFSATQPRTTVTLFIRPRKMIVHVSLCPHFPPANETKNKLSSIDLTPSAALFVHILTCNGEDCSHFHMNFNHIKRLQYPCQEEEVSVSFFPPLPSGS